MCCPRLCARQRLSAVWVRCASRAAQLLKLAVERLAHGVDAGIAETAVFRINFSHVFR
jgi:hypothetical protein